MEGNGDEDGAILKQFLQDQLFIYPRSVTQRSWKRREGVVRRSCAIRGSVTQVVGASYDGRAAVPSISREGVTQKSCRVTATQRVIKVTEQSACFSHGGVTAFTERRVTGVLRYVGGSF